LTPDGTGKERAIPLMPLLCPEKSGAPLSATKPCWRPAQVYLLKRDGIRETWPVDARGIPGDFDCLPG